MVRLVQRGWRLWSASTWCSPSRATRGHCQRSGSVCGVFRRPVHVRHTAPIFCPNLESCTRGEGNAGRSLYSRSRARLWRADSVSGSSAYAWCRWRSQQRLLHHRSCGSALGVGPGCPERGALPATVVTNCPTSRQSVHTCAPYDDLATRVWHCISAQHWQSWCEQTWSLRADGPWVARNLPLRPPRRTYHAWVCVRNTTDKESQNVTSPFTPSAQS